MGTARAHGTVGAGDYELQELIGAGASGTVWRARRRGPVPQVVAVKRLPAGSAQAGPGPDGLARLRHEAVVLTELDHPHIVRVLEVVPDGDGVAICMQYAPGGSLQGLLASRGRLPPGEVVAVALPIAEALASAHRRGVVHGDVKPANILFTSDGEPLLGDFGVAHLRDGPTGLTGDAGASPPSGPGRPTPDAPSAPAGSPDAALEPGGPDAPSPLTGGLPPAMPETGPRPVVGSAQYLAPELLHGAAPDPRSDVYALAVACYEALTGRPPHDAPTPEAVLWAAEAAAHEPLTARPDIPGPLAAVVEQALARDPNQRVPTADLLADALRGALPHQEIRLPRLAPVAAPPAPPAPAGHRTPGAPGGVAQVTTAPPTSDPATGGPGTGGAGTTGTPTGGPGTGGADTTGEPRRPTPSEPAASVGAAGTPDRSTPGGTATGAGATGEPDRSAPDRTQTTAPSRGWWDGEPGAGPAAAGGSWPAGGIGGGSFPDGDVLGGTQDGGAGGPLQHGSAGESWPEGGAGGAQVVGGWSEDDPTRTTRTFGPRPPRPEPPPVRRRPRLSLTLVVGLGAAGLIYLVRGPLGSDDGCPEPEAPAADPGVQVVAGDPEGDGCPTYGTYQGRTLAGGQQAMVLTIEVGGEPQRIGLGEAGDQLLLGDWDCDGRDTPALYRPVPGEVRYFGAWPQRENRSYPPERTETVPPAGRATVRRGDEPGGTQRRCDEVEIRTGTET